MSRFVHDAHRAFADGMRDSIAILHDLANEGISQPAVPFRAEHRIWRVLDREPPAALHRGGHAFRMGSPARKKGLFHGRCGSRSALLPRLDPRAVPDPEP